MKTIEFKQMLGNRKSDSDGFTYPYGKFKFNKNTRSNSIRSQIRYDKRSVKSKELERELQDVADENGFLLEGKI